MYDNTFTLLSFGSNKSQQYKNIVKHFFTSDNIDYKTYPKESLYSPSVLMKISEYIHHMNEISDKFWPKNVLLQNEVYITLYIKIIESN